MAGTHSDIAKWVGIWVSVVGVGVALGVHGVALSYAAGQNSRQIEMNTKAIDTLNTAVVELQKLVRLYEERFGRLDSDKRQMTNDIKENAKAIQDLIVKNSLTP